MPAMHTARANMNVEVTVTENEAAYIEAARKCSAANGGSFAPEDLCLYGYEARGQSLNGTTGSLVAKEVIAEPEGGWSWLLARE